jgi:hypothetical protein
MLGVESLDVTKCQSFYADFEEVAEKCDGEIEAIVYFPDANKTTNAFLLVRNQFSFDERNWLIVPIPFEALG